MNGSDKTEVTEGASSGAATCYADAKTVGVRLRWLRKRSKMTIDDMVEKSGTSKGNYSKMENGNIDNPGIYTIFKICAALEISIEDLYLA